MNNEANPHEEHIAARTEPGASSSSAHAAPVADAGADHAREASTPAAQPEATAVFVTRSRSLNLGGMVVIALIVGAVAGIVWALFNGTTMFGALVVSGLYGLFFLGSVLALIVVAVDWAIERSRR